MPEVTITKFITKNISTLSETDRTFSGYMTVEIIDNDHELVVRDQIIKSMTPWFECGAPLTDSHSNRHVGRALSFESKELDGVPAIYIKGMIFNKYHLHDYIWEAIKSGEYGHLTLSYVGKCGNYECTLCDEEYILEKN